MSRRNSMWAFYIFILCSLFSNFSTLNASNLLEDQQTREEKDQLLSSGSLVKKKDVRKLISSSEYGEVSAVSLDGIADLASYSVQFICLQPSAIFLPVVLFSDMVLYVHTGSGSLSHTVNEGRMQTKKLKQGDVFVLTRGNVFFIESFLGIEKLQIHAIFGNLEELPQVESAAPGPYSSFRNLLLDFDKKILQQTFKVSVQVIEEIFNASSPPAIVPAAMCKAWELEANLIQGFPRINGAGDDQSDVFNMFSTDRDFENHNGWIATLKKGKKVPEYLKGLLGLKFGSFLTNLTSGSMVAPHWNPMATEISIVLQGKGMVRVVCSAALMNNSYIKTPCKDTRFMVEVGDVFVVPRLHPTAQMSFGDDVFVFVGFSTSATKVKKISHQFLVGKMSIFRALGRNVLATSLGVNITIINEILGAQLGETAVTACNLCAEEELGIMKETMEKEKQKTGEAEAPQGEPGKAAEPPEEKPGKEIGTPEESWKIEMKIDRQVETWRQS